MNVSNVLLAAEAVQLQPTDQQLQLLLQQVLKVLPQAKPQEASNTVWAVASIHRQIPAQQLEPVLQHFMKVLPKANPQDVSNILWAVASMQQYVPKQHVPEHQLQQMEQRSVELLAQAKPQDESNTMWAFGKLQYAPQELLSALEQHPEQLQALMAASTAQGLANIAWACGQMGYKGRLAAVLLQQATQVEAGKQGNLKLQDLSNLCWAATVLDLQHSLPQVLQLAAATGGLWVDRVAETLQQMYQVHLWLLDSQLPAPNQGLSGVLSPQQLQQCKEGWEQQLALSAQQQVTDLQQSVFAAVQQLPAGTWQKQPQLEQRTPDGAFSIDITATTAAGVQLAIEVDGLSHFIQPGNTLEGATQFRNRALAARGYVVVSIPFWEWDTLRGAEQKHQHLLSKLQPAVHASRLPASQPLQQQQQPGQQQQPTGVQAAAAAHAANAAADTGPALAARRRRRKPLSP